VWLNAITDEQQLTPSGETRSNKDGVALTPQKDRTIEEQVAAIGAIPLGRLGTADEIAKAVVVLAPAPQQRHDGAEMFVDGGFARV
jgi:NAD(P)-dependent dehydrogenase (short-subunit alcohol dehydrogenase family)